MIGYVDSSIHERDHAEVGTARRRCRTPRHVRRCRRVVGRAGAGRPVGLHALLEEPQARGPGARNGRAPGPGHRGDRRRRGRCGDLRPSAQHIPPVDEPEVYIDLLITAREFTGRGVGAFLLTEARAEARRRGRSLVRVDCWAGGDGALVRYYRGQGFTPTVTFEVDGWPGQVLEDRLPPR